MTIRASFQPNVDEFISNLEEFATGSYLREEEREFWDQPFDPAVVPQLRDILEGFLDTLDNLPKAAADASVEGNTEGPDAEALQDAVASVIENIDAFNTKHADAVVEPEERAELNDLIARAAAQTGADSAILGGLPELE